MKIQILSSKDAVHAVFYIEHVTTSKTSNNDAVCLHEAVICTNNNINVYI